MHAFRSQNKTFFIKFQQQTVGRASWQKFLEILDMHIKFILFLTNSIFAKLWYSLNMSWIICHKNSLQYFSSTSHIMREWVTATENLFAHIFWFFTSTIFGNNKKSLLHINAYRKKFRAEWKWKFMVERAEIFLQL